MQPKLNSGIPEAAPCGYMSYDDRANVVQCNRYICSMLEYEPEELQGKLFESVLTVASKIFFQTHLFPMVCLHGNADEIFLSLRRKDGKALPVVTNLCKESTPEGNIYHCIFISIPNRRKYEDELLLGKKAAEEKLQSNSELNRLKASNEEQARELDKHIHLQNCINDDLKQLTYIINHDMQEAIRKVIVMAKRMEDTQDLGSLHKILMSAHRLKAINNTLDLYVKTLRPQKEHFGKVHLENVMREGLNLALIETEFDNVELTGKPLPQIFGSATQLTQLFYQLFSNSVKFRKNNAVKVHIDHVEMELNTYKQIRGKYIFREFVRIQFSDDGVGFDDAYTEYVFDLLKKMDADTNLGLGFGLPICKKIAENHMGEISISSTLGAGTTVTLTLPMEKF